MNKLTSKIVELYSSDPSVNAKQEVEKKETKWELGVLVWGVFVVAYALFLINATLANASDFRIEDAGRIARNVKTRSDQVTLTGLIRCEKSAAQTQMNMGCDIYMEDSRSRESFKLMGSAYLSKLFESGIRSITVAGRLSQPNTLEVQQIILF